MFLHGEAAMRSVVGKREVGGGEITPAGALAGSN